MTLPVVTSDPRDPKFFNDPYPIYSEMRAAGPAFIWEQYGLTCFARYEAVNALLRDRRFGREATHVMSREEAGLEPVPAHLKPFYAFEENSMLEREPPAHTRLRRLVNRAFVSRHIDRMWPRVEVLANELIDDFAHAGRVDLLPAYAEKIPVIIIAEMLGVPASMADQLLEWSHKMVAMYQYNRDRKTEDHAVAATLAFSDFIRGHIENRRTQPADDLISVLIAAEQQGDKLSHDELVTTCILLLNAGHEATVHGIGNAVKAILENNIDVDAVFSDRQSGLAAADELLRYDAPLHLFTRFVLEETGYNGVELRRGQQIGLLLGSANRDENRFANADQLDFVRGGSGHVAFGAGIHFCVGAPLARLEIAAALPILFGRLPGLQLAAPPKYADRYHFHGLDKLEVCW